MFQIQLNQIERIEYKIAVKNGKTYNHLCKWSKYLQIQNRKKNPMYTAMLKPIEKCPTIYAQLCYLSYYLFNVDVLSLMCRKCSLCCLFL